MGYVNGSMDGASGTPKQFDLETRVCPRSRMESRWARRTDRMQLLL